MFDELNEMHVIEGKVFYTKVRWMNANSACCCTSGKFRVRIQIFFQLLF